MRLSSIRLPGAEAVLQATNRPLEVGRPILLELVRQVALSLDAVAILIYGI
jgi:hypothetical protein